MEMDLILGAENLNEVYEQTILKREQFRKEAELLRVSMVCFSGMGVL